MNTFLPYADFEQSAKCLDNARLGKQRVEVLQLLNGSFPNHPASKMWLPDYRYALAVYGLYVCVEWQSRGFKDTCYQKIKALMPPSFEELNADCEYCNGCGDEVPSAYWVDAQWCNKCYSELITSMPPWFGDHPFHSDCRANLLRKDPVWYGQFGWSEQPLLGYRWPRN